MKKHNRCHVMDGYSMNRGTAFVGRESSEARREFFSHQCLRLGLNRAGDCPAHADGRDHDIGPGAFKK
jgi:hypothetical protein